jgi:hypothetical protein
MNPEIQRNPHTNGLSKINLTSRGLMRAELKDTAAIEARRCQHCADTPFSAAKKWPTRHGNAE